MSEDETILHSNDVHTLSQSDWPSFKNSHKKKKKRSIPEWRRNHLTL